MHEILNTVTIGGKKLPIKCDFNCLQVLQDSFGTLKNFEQKLIGMIPVLDENGDPTYTINSSGEETLQFKTTEPSLKAIALVLPLFLKEGREQADSQGDITNKDFDWRTAVKEADFSIVEVAVELHTEYRRCYDRKKLKASKSTHTKTQ